jgi:hypothetical protein
MKTIKQLQKEKDNLVTKYHRHKELADATLRKVRKLNNEIVTRIFKLK